MKWPSRVRQVRLRNADHQKMVSKLAVTYRPEGRRCATSAANPLVRRRVRATTVEVLDQAQEIVECHGHGGR